MEQNEDMIKGPYVVWCDVSTLYGSLYNG